MQRIELNLAEMETLLDRARREPLPEADYQKLKGALETLGYLTQLLEDKQTTIGRLSQLLFGASTEKTSPVLKQAEPAGQRRGASAPPAPGHGRNSAAAYTGARRIDVPQFLAPAR